MASEHVILNNRRDPVGRRPYNNQCSWMFVVTVSSGFSIFGLSVYFLAGLLREYGLSGTFNYIWEGDPYPQIREYLNALDCVENNLRKESSTIDILQEALQGAQSTCNKSSPVGKPEVQIVVELWQRRMDAINNGKSNLKSILGSLSYRLDALAAKVDAVPGDVSQATIVKKRKKMLSTQVVELMERTDQLISTLQKVSSLA